MLYARLFHRPEAVIHQKVPCAMWRHLMPYDLTESCCIGEGAVRKDKCCDIYKLGL